MGAHVAAHDGVRDWMNRNSGVVSEVVIVFFLALTSAGLAGL